MAFGHRTACTEWNHANGISCSPCKEPTSSQNQEKKSQNQLQNQCNPADSNFLKSAWQRGNCDILATPCLSPSRFHIAQVSLQLAQRQQSNAWQKKNIACKGAPSLGKWLHMSIARAIKELQRVIWAIPPTFIKDRRRPGKIDPISKKATSPQTGRKICRQGFPGMGDSQN